MQMPNTLFAIVLGVIALYAAYSAIRAAGGRRKTGWLLLAVAAAVQVANLLTDYSMTLAILSTAVLLVGLWLVRPPAGPVERV